MYASAWQALAIARGRISPPRSKKRHICAMWRHEGMLTGVIMKVASLVKFFFRSSHALSSSACRTPQRRAGFTRAATLLIRISPWKLNGKGPAIHFLVTCDEASPHSPVAFGPDPRLACLHLFAACRTGSSLEMGASWRGVDSWLSQRPYHREPVRNLSRHAYLPMPLAWRVFLNKGPWI